jgi:dienelactone hydrolase
VKVRPSTGPAAARRHNVGWTLVLLFAAAALVVPRFGAAQEAPGERVTIPGAEISEWGKVGEFPARFGRPRGSTGKVPAVLILHGSGGVDGRGAFHATALQEAGIATLEITMFPAGGRPRAGRKANMPHVAAALKWLAAQPNVDVQRLGVMGFSWGGGIAVLMSSELVQERLGKDVPKPAAFAPLYPVCSGRSRDFVNPQNPFYNAHARMSTAPMLIYVGTLDDYEQGERPCDAMVAMWPAAARDHASVRNVEGATHGFDSQRPARRFYDELVHPSGGMVRVNPSPKAAEEARQAIVRHFVKNLNP